MTSINRIGITQNLEPPRPRLPLSPGGDPTLAERLDEKLSGFGERRKSLTVAACYPLLTPINVFIKLPWSRSSVPLVLSSFVLAGRYGTRDILTLDERHFRTMRDPQGRPFLLLPADI
jgi:hypothetical protein